LGEPHCFSALIKDLSPESRERIEVRLAQGFSLTQHTLARILDVKQAEISKIEPRADIVVPCRCELSSPAAPARTVKRTSLRIGGRRGFLRESHCQAWLFWEKTSPD
jgi:hypothetical protein